MQPGTLASGRQAARRDSILQRKPIGRGSNRQCLTRLETSATSRKQTAAHDSNRHNRATFASPSPIFAPRFSLNAPRQFATQIAYESSCNQLKTQHIAFPNRNNNPRIAIGDSCPPKLVRVPRCAPEFPHFLFSKFRFPPNVPTDSMLCVPGTARHHPALLRSAATGCISQSDPCATPNPS